VEKDGTSGNATQHYQTITLQDPYKNWSLEELRIVDYNQGRRYGNQNGQAGAFGQSSGFGGFGNTSNTTTSFGSNANSGGGGLFGNNANNTTSTPFGQSNTTTTFGSGTNTTGGGLFGQNKPAGGLFGSTSTPQPATGGGLFGGSNTNAGGFGSGGGNAFGSSTSGGGGLFGQQNQTQNKPAFGGFGASTTTGSTPFGGSSTGGFGTNNNTSGGGLFGQQNQASAAPAFGSTNTTSNNTGGLFGGGGSSFGQNQTQNQNQPAGNLFGGFGQNNQQNQQKPAGGLFGSSTTNTTTGGGLFGGNNNQPQQTGGLFGGNNNQPQQTGGLFGGGATQNAGNSLFGNKPAATGGLFGNAPQNTGSTGGGLFGGLNTQNNQQNQGSSLFGQQNQQKPGGGLFGNSTTNTNTGGGLFGSLGQNNNQPQQSGGLGGSLFGNQSQQQQQQPQGSSLFGASGGSLLQTSINTNPYGNDSLFAGLTTPSQSPGPLATPLSSSQKPRKNAILPQHKLNPSASTRLTTPQNKRLGGYGFSYSTYGSPASASSSSSPGFSSFLGGSGSLTRSLGKSLSTSNLRNSYNPEASILAPGAFSTNGRSYASGSLKKLNINRNINARTPLFDEPPEKKRVSFANGSTNGGAATGQEVALRDQPEVASPSEGASSQSSSTVNGDAVNGTPSRPEMSQVNGNGLTPVPENGALAPRTSASLNKQLQVQDQTPGQYYSEPPMAQLRKMDRNSLSAVPNFKVGRQGMGEILFNMGKPVDLTGVDLDKVFGDIVDFNTTRIVKVYPETYNKPALGSGLNLPSRVTLANSWPRNKYGRKDTKHLERLKRIDDCSFVAYRPETGEWVFDVPHFSSYGLDYDGEQYSDEDDEESDLSDAPDSPAQLRSSQMSSTPQKDQDDSLVDETQSSPDDTFDFKKDKRKRASVPGGYGDEVPYEEDDSMDMTGESFLGERSVGSLDGQKEDYSEDSESEQDEDQDMADSVSGPVQTTEQPAAKGSIMPKSILKNSQVLRPTLGTPSKGPLVFDDDWANQLQRTISPKKQDRRALRESQGDVLRERDTNATKLGQSANGQETFTRMEMMESMFGEADKGKGLMKRSGHGIEV
jgi:nuclear pore complex protein Nup98-Nup96